MEFQLKRLSRAGIDEALKKAERYRLLQEPWEAESICLDILEIDPQNQPALVTLLLAITDEFQTEGARRPEDARAVLPRLLGEYERAYYAGVIAERRAMAILNRGRTGAGPVAFEGLRDAMDWYEKAEALRPEGDDSALLRWNTCARAIMSHAEVRPIEAAAVQELLE